jgi:hypothetical protein
MPKPVQVGATALALSKAYALKGKLPLQLDEIIVPVHIVGRLDVGTGTPCSGTSAAPDSVGEFAMAGLRNPVASGVIARVTHIGVGTIPAAVGGWSLRREEAPFAIVPDASNTGFTRYATDWNRAAALLLTSVNEVAVTAAGPFHFQDDSMDPNDAFDFLLLPGTGLWVVANNTAEPVRANFYWTEEPLEPSQT